MSNILYDQVGLSGKPYRRGQWENIVTHDQFVVKGFFGPYRFLSNMWPVNVTFSGQLYPSVENAYQAAKFPVYERGDFLVCTPYEAKKHSIERAMLYSKDEWAEWKVVVMRFLLLQKFDRRVHPDLWLQLFTTTGKLLEETNWWDDTFWGRTLEGVGKNMLGNLLMEIRGQ